MTGSNARYCRCGARLARDNNADSRCSACVSAERDRIAAAPRVPAGFWHETVIQEALASEHMGRVIRAWRTHPHHGRQNYPQDRVATWVGLTQTQLSRIENGAPLMHLDRLREWATALKIPAERLWFSLPNSNTTIRPPSRQDTQLDVASRNRHGVEIEASQDATWTPTETTDLISYFTRKDLSVDRREAARTLAGMAFGTTFLERLERWLIPPERYTLCHAGPTGIGVEEVEHIEHSAQVFRSWDNHFGGGLRRKAVIGQLSEVADELRSFSHPPLLERRLFATMAQLAGIAATMSWDSGLSAVAQQYYVLALRAAREAGDRAFGANVLAGMARQLFCLGRTADGLELVRLAQVGKDSQITPTIRAMLCTREAWAYAKQGRLAAFRRATNRAEDLLRDAQPSQDPYWIRYFDEAELAGVTGGRLLEAAHQTPSLSADAVSHISRAIRLRKTQSLRSTALDQLGLAEAYLLQDEVEEACRLGHEAAGLAEKTHSDRVRIKLAELYDYSERHKSVASIAQFRDRVRGILTTSHA